MTSSHGARTCGMQSPEVRLTYDCNTEHDDIPFGVRMGKKRASCFRVLSINVGCLPSDIRSNNKHRNFFDLINGTECDVACFSEHGLNFSKLPKDGQWKERIAGQWELSRHRLAWNIHDHSGTKKVFGGTGISSIGSMALKMCDTGVDTSGLGRWAWMRFQEKLGFWLRIVAIYCPASDHGGPNSVAEQHRRYFMSRADKSSPTDAFCRDLRSFLSEVLQSGDHLLVVGDFNSDLSVSNKITKMFGSPELRMYEIFQRFYAGQATPNTFASRSSSKTIDGAWASSSLVVESCGYLSFGQWDHRPLWMDFSFRPIFGHRAYKVVKPAARRLKLELPAVKKAYTSSYLKQVRQCGLLRKVQQVQSAIYTAFFGQPGYSPAAQALVTYDNIDSLLSQHQHLFQQLERCDALRTGAMLHAEKKCRKLRMGGVSYSPEVSRAGMAINLYKLLIKRAVGRPVNSKKIIRLSRSAKIPMEEFQYKSLEELISRRIFHERHYRSLKVHHVELRKTFYQQLIDKESPGSSDHRNYLQRRIYIEEQRRQAKTISFALAKVNHSGVHMVTQPLPGGGTMALYEEAEVVAACLEGSKAKYTNVYTSQVNRFPYKDLGFMGCTPTANLMLAGELPLADLPSLHQCFISSLARPADIPANSISTMVPVDNHIRALRRIRERTSSSPSGLHYGTWKGNSEVPQLALIDSMMREIPMVTGYSLVRWQRMLDILLMKEKNNFSLNKIRTIGLLEGDYQLNNKLISQRVMSQASDFIHILSVNSPEQHGAKKYHRVQEASLNSRLIYDFIRLQHISAGIVGVDAETCFDRISHPILSLCLQRLGLPLTAVRSTLHTIQQASHHVRTAFGDSTEHYSGSTRYPLQGMPQGHCTGPCACIQVSTPIINCIRRMGYGFNHVSPISHIPLSIVATVFVDDAQLFQSNSSFSNADELAQATQAMVDAWSAALSLTGGALVPSKSAYTWMIMDCNESGNWSLRKPSKIPHKISITDSKGFRTHIAQLSPHHAERELGVKIQKDGRDKGNEEFFRSKCVQWADLIRTNKLHKEDVWQALKMTIWKGIEFPLIATCLSAFQCKRIMAPALLSGLANSGVQSRLPRSLVHGPLSAQGLGIPDIFIMQAIEHLQVLLRHASFSSPFSHTASLLRATFESIHLHTGTSVPLWQLNPEKWGCLVPASWLRSTWVDFYYLGIKVESPRVHLPLFREHDTFIMDKIVSLGVTEPQLTRFNWCRMYLNVLRCSEIASACGRYISHDSWNCIKRKECSAQLGWPLARKPSKQAVATWQALISRAFLKRPNDRSLAHPLGDPILSDHWRWFYHSFSDRVYVHDGDQWEVRSRQPRINSHRFVYAGFESTLPAGCVLASGYVKRNSPFLFIDSFGSPSVCPSPAPAAPSSFLEYLMALPPNRKWQVQHHIVRGSLSDIVGGLLSSHLICVSDGSLKDSIGTSAFTITSDNPQASAIIGVNRTPGISTFLESQRAELSGLDGIITMVEALSEFFCVPYRSSSVLIACDNVGALRVVDPEYVFSPNDADYDYLSSLQWRISQSRITWVSQHVKGHQDQQRKCSLLSTLERLNVEMDSLAKSFWLKVSSTGDTFPPFPDPLCEESCSFCIEGEKWHCANKQLLYSALAHPKAVSYWTTKRRITASDVPRIDWSLIRSYMSELFPARRRWLVKHWSANCGIGKTMVKWGYWQDDKCPRCLAPEDRDHVLRCPHPAARGTWACKLSDLHSLLVSSHTHPLLTTLFLQRLSDWHDFAVSSSVSLPPAFAEAAAHQFLLAGFGRKSGLRFNLSTSYLYAVGIQVKGGQ